MKREAIEVCFPHFFSLTISLTPSNTTIAKNDTTGNPHVSGAPSGDANDNTETDNDKINSDNNEIDNGEIGNDNEDDAKKEDDDPIHPLF